MKEGNCETRGHWDDNLVDGMCSECTDKYIDHEQTTNSNTIATVEQLDSGNVLFCISPDQHGAQCQSMTREELAGIRNTINHFFINNK